MIARSSKKLKGEVYNRKVNFEKFYESLTGLNSPTARN